MRTIFLTAAAALALAACGQTTTDETSSSADVPAIASDAGNTYPSQAAEGSVMTTPGAEGGRGSAATGASDPASAGAAGGDAAADSEQTPP